MYLSQCFTKKYVCLCQPGMINRLKLLVSHWIVNCVSHAPEMLWTHNLIVWWGKYLPTRWMSGVLTWRESEVTSQRKLEELLDFQEGPQGSLWVSLSIAIYTAGSHREYNMSQTTVHLQGSRCTSQANLDLVGNDSSSRGEFVEVDESQCSGHPPVCLIPDWACWTRWC